MTLLNHMKLQAFLLRSPWLKTVTGVVNTLEEMQADASVRCDGDDGDGRRCRAHRVLQGLRSSFPEESYKPT